MNTEYARLAVEVLKSMYEHNSKSFTSIGRTDIGPEQLTAEKVADDLKVIYNELINHDS